VDLTLNNNQARIELERYNEAINKCDRALEINPNHANAWVNKGYSLNSLGKLDEAIECYNKALEINPNHAAALYNRACSNVKRGNIENALEDLKTAIKIDKEECIRSAKEDGGFESIKNDKRFRDLLNL
jgi:tetratricopeptide (TPR) repeat protein